MATTNIDLYILQRKIQSCTKLCYEKLHSRFRYHVWQRQHWNGLWRISKNKRFQERHHNHSALFHIPHKREVRIQIGGAWDRECVFLADLRDVYLWVVMSDRARQLLFSNGLSILPWHTHLKNQIGFSDQIFDHYHNSGFLHGLKNRQALVNTKYAR